MHMLVVFSKVFVFTFFIRLANLFYRRNLRHEYWTSKTNNLMSYDSGCCLMQIDCTTCPHYQMKMLRSTNIMQMNCVHHHHSLKQSWDRGHFSNLIQTVRWRALLDYVQPELTITLFGKFEKLVFLLMSNGTPLTSVLFRYLSSSASHKLCRIRLVLY